MNPPVVVASHMRSGTHLTIDLLRRNVGTVSADYLNLDRLLPDHGEPIPVADFEQRLEALRGAALLKTHTPARAAWFAGGDPGSRRGRDLLGAARAVYVVRDGRDVLVSLYYYMRHYSPRVRGQSFAAFLRDRDDFFQGCEGFSGLDRPSAWALHVTGWLAEPGAVVVRYEDLLAHRERTVRDLALRLGLPVPARVDGIAVPSGLPRRVLRKVALKVRPRCASTAIAPRLGVVGDASRHFSPEDDAFFRQRAGAVSERLEGRALAS
jgi:hypothetical protein